MLVSYVTRVILAKARVVVHGCTFHENKGCNPSQRACRPLKWIPAYAGMTTKNLNLPALGLVRNEYEIVQPCPAIHSQFAPVPFPLLLSVKRFQHYA